MHRQSTREGRGPAGGLPELPASARQFLPLPQYQGQGLGLQRPRPPPSPTRGGREAACGVRVPARSSPSQELPYCGSTGADGNPSRSRRAPESKQERSLGPRQLATAAVQATAVSQHCAREAGERSRRLPAQRIARLPHAMLETRVPELYLGHLVLVAPRGAAAAAARPQHGSRQLEIQRRVPSARAAAAAATDSLRGPSLPKEPHGTDSQPDPSRRRRLRGPSWGGSRSYGVQILLEGGAATPAVRQHGSHAEPGTPPPPNHSRPPPRRIPGR